MSLSTSLIAGAALSLASAASANHIDFIQDDSDPSNGLTNAIFSVSSNNNTPVTDTQIGEGADILGGTRTVTVRRDDGFGGSITATKAAGTDFIAVRNDTVAAGILTLDYLDFEDLDFASRWDSVVVNIDRLFQSTGVGDAEVTIGVRFFNGMTSEIVFADRLEASLNPGDQDVIFRFSEYSDIDFTSIDGVSVVFDTNIIGTDFDIGSITRELVDAAPVPAPAAFALFGLGLIGAGALRRKRR
ncbi:MAG: PEP-CTERM sorting domain-containing protein [Pacificimonas sp.]